MEGDEERKSATNPDARRVTGAWEEEGRESGRESGREGRCEEGRSRSGLASSLRTDQIGCESKVLSLCHTSNASEIS